MISFDDDDNILSTEVAAITIVSNGFDGGEEIRLGTPAAPNFTHTTSAVQQMNEGRTPKPRHGPLRT